MQNRIIKVYWMDEYGNESKAMILDDKIHIGLLNRPSARLCKVELVDPTNDTILQTMIEPNIKQIQANQFTNDLLDTIKEIRK